MDLNEFIYNCDWDQFPSDIQRMLRIIMINAQRPVFFQGFGNILCTRDTFKKVISFGI